MASDGPAVLRAEVRPDLEFLREIKAHGGERVKRCMQCATCSSVCELSGEQSQFPRKEMLWAGWGLKDRLLADPDVFLCYGCGDCTARCPRGARPADVMASVRAAAYRHLAFPSFLGEALATPVALLALLLVPIVVLGLLLVRQHGDLGTAAALLDAPSVTYSAFLRHGLLEALFMIGNAVVFAVAAVGFVRFYRSLEAGGPKPVLGFLAAATKVVRDVVAHRRFPDCGVNRPRRTAHLLALLGFVGAMATAGLAVGYMLLWQWRHPGQHFGGLGLANPIKWLGVASGLAMVVGTFWMIARRQARPDEVGEADYGDRLFVWALAIVAVTGLATWLLRLAAMAGVAYPVYFVHLVFVFFLLWYMPFGKFAHMVYRSLALLWAYRVGRLR